MASNTFVTCNSATSWYDFAYALSWSNECEVAELLSDIPFISVGVLVLGVSALFLVMKRVPPSVIWLFLSVFLAFLAAVLDLGKVLANGMAINTISTASEAVIRAREVFFAWSIGFRLSFYWSYVAEPPRKNLSATSVQKVGFLPLELTYEPHSGSWARWGRPGKLLRAGLLAAIITITALQIIWRVIPQFHQYSNVYGTDTALQLLVSFLLLLKLLLNTLNLNSPGNTSVHTFRECLAPISGLLINIATGVGNLLCFAFTESTVGRLLQAFEVYIIVVFVVVVAFLRHRDILLSTISSRGGRRRDVIFTLPEPARGSTFRITPPLVETPRMSLILDTAVQNKTSSREALHRSARRSLHHVSSWVSSRISRHRTHYEDEEARLWNAEKAKVNPPYTEDAGSELTLSSVSPTQEPRELAELRAGSANINHASIMSALDAQSALARSMEGSIYSGQHVHPPRVDTSQHATPPSSLARTGTVPVSSVPSPVSSGTKKAGSTMAMASMASPVYGLSGIQSHGSAANSRTSLEELLRQQSQLDQSIEALRLFSARMSANSLHSNSASGPRSIELSRSPSSGQRTVSSVVSLSSFPIPPWLTTPVPSLPSSRPTSVKRIRGSRRARFATARPTPVHDTYETLPPKTSSSLVNIPSPPRFSSIPHTPLGDDNEPLSAEVEMTSHFDSGGTQYNVTSFIGGLATPGESGRGSQEQPRWSRPGGDPSVEATQTSSGVNKLPRRMLPRMGGLPASPAAAKLAPFARSSVLPPENVVNGLANTVQYQTNKRTSRALPVPPYSPSVIPATGPQVAAKPNLLITESAEGTHQAQKVFVRPRPPPIVIQPYKQDSDVPVLTDA